MTDSPVDHHQHRELSIDQQLALKTAATRLEREFASTFGVETIGRYARVRLRVVRRERGRSQLPATRCGCGYAWMGTCRSMSSRLTRSSMSSRIGRTPSRPCPAGSSRTHSS